MSSIPRVASWLMTLPANACAIQVIALPLGGEELLQEWQPPYPSPGELARMICELAQEDCNERDETMRYAVRALRPSEPPIQTVTKCRVSGKAGYQTPGDTQGVVGQTLRHTEAMARIYVQAQTTAFGTLQGQNAELRKENGELRQLVRDLFTHLQARLTGDDEDDLKSSAILEKAMGYAETYLLPAVAQAVAERVATEPASAPAAPKSETEH